LLEFTKKKCSHALNVNGRSMVQVFDRNRDGSINSLRVHDILRDLAIQKAKENKFLVVCSNQADWELPHCREARRVAVHYSNFNESMQQYASPNLRSLLIFGDSKLDCSEFRLLRVLAIMDKKVELESFPRLPHLRYLQLHPPRELNEQDFEKWISTMKSLETLDLGDAFLGDLINWLWKIETLRHVRLGEHTEGPPASANLPNLQTLIGVKFSPSWDTSKLPNVPEMRQLDLMLTSDDQSGVIAALLGKLNHLVYLQLSGNYIQIQEFEGVFPTCENLKQMYIWNETDRRSTVELKDNMLPPNLIELRLSGFEFKSDPMPVLEKLGSLKILQIGNSNILDPLKISCSAGGFKQLENLNLYGIARLQELRIELGALPLLEELRLLDIAELQELKIELGALPLLKYLSLLQIAGLQELTIELGALPLLEGLNVFSCHEELPVPQLQWFIDHKRLRFLQWSRHRCPDAEKALTEIRNARPDIIIDDGE
jgi:hypothetical protein